METEQKDYGSAEPIQETITWFPPRSRVGFRVHRTTHQRPSFKQPAWHFTCLPPPLHPVLLEQQSLHLYCISRCHGKRSSILHLSCVKRKHSERTLRGEIEGLRDSSDRVTAAWCAGTVPVKSTLRFLAWDSSLVYKTARHGDGANYIRGATDCVGCLNIIFLFFTTDLLLRITSTEPFCFI